MIDLCLHEKSNRGSRVTDLGGQNSRGIDGKSIGTKKCKHVLNIDGSLAREAEVVESDQKLLINDVKNSLTIELRGVEGSTIVTEESSVGASAANAVIQMSVWETQNVVRAPRGCTEPRLTLVVQIGLGLWRSRDMWSDDPGQVFQVTGQRVSAESERLTAKRKVRFVSC